MMRKPYFKPESSPPEDSPKPSTPETTNNVEIERKYLPRLKLIKRILSGANEAIGSKKIWESLNDGEKNLFSNKPQNLISFLQTAAYNNEVIKEVDELKTTKPATRTHYLYRNKSS